MIRYRPPPRKKRPRLGLSGRPFALSPDFQVWLAENRLNGLPREKLFEVLASQGVPRREVERRLAELEASPAFVAARAVAQKARRLKLVTELRRSVSRCAADAGRVERTEDPSSDEFLTRYFATNTPVVLTRLMRGWPALEAWTPEYFRDRFGSAAVEIADGRDSDPNYDANFLEHARTVTLAQYVDRVLAAGVTNDLYMIANNRNLERPELRGLFDDVRWPPYLDPARAAGGSALWIGPAGTVTPLHHDTSSIVFCQMHGRKRITLISPLEANLLEAARGVYSAIDPEAPDLERFPWFRDVAVKSVDLAPGEALFIPVGYWHHVRALDVSISLALNNFRVPNRYEWYKPGAV